MQVLPGSDEIMVGGQHMCMFHNIEKTQLKIRDLLFNCIYMHIAYQKTNEYPYNKMDCEAVLKCINIINNDNLNASNILIDGFKGDNHPLPGVYTIINKKYSIDFRIYTYKNHKNIWVELYYI